MFWYIALAARTPLIDVAVIIGKFAAIVPMHTGHTIVFVIYKEKMFYARGYARVC
jgi:hypothetical protein